MGLKSHKMGSLGVVVIPSCLHTTQDKRDVWEPRISETKRYVYCHNNLAQYNMFADPKTLQVISLIDWEYSGYFPSDIEIPFWHYSREEQRLRLDNEGYDRVDKRFIYMTDECTRENQRLIGLIDAPGEIA